MAMRETVRSLRAYFILSGLLSLVYSATALRATLQNPSAIPAILDLITVAIALAFIYVGFALPGLLRGSVERVVTLLYASTGWSVFVFLLTLMQGFNPVAFGFLILTVLILWYLLRNVRRLAAEAQITSPEMVP